MNEPPKMRRFWQLHLSTAVYVSIIVTIWLAVVKYTIYRFPDGSFIVGWPYQAVASQDLRYKSLFRLDFGGIELFMGCPVDWKNVLIDFAIPVLAISTFVIVSEYLICRREGRRP